MNSQIKLNKKYQSFLLPEIGIVLGKQIWENGIIYLNNEFNFRISNEFEKNQTPSIEFIERKTPKQKLEVLNYFPTPNEEIVGIVKHFKEPIQSFQHILLENSSNKTLQLKMFELKYLYSKPEQIFSKKEPIKITKKNFSETNNFLESYIFSSNLEFIKQFRIDYSNF